MSTLKSGQCVRDGWKLWFTFWIPGSRVLHTQGCLATTFYSCSTASPAASFESKVVGIRPMDTLERSLFIRFSWGPSPKYHFVGRDSAWETLPVCVCAQASSLLTATGSSRHHHPFPGSWASEHRGGWQEHALILETTFPPILLPFLKTLLSLGFSGASSVFRALWPPKWKHEFVDLNFLFSNNIWRKEEGNPDGTVLWEPTSSPDPRRSSRTFPELSRKFWKPIQKILTASSSPEESHLP